MSLKKIATISAVYLSLLLLVEGSGQLTIYYLESKAPSGLFGEDLLAHNEPVLGFGLKKNININYGHWNAKTNSLGFRDAEISADKPKNEFRIVVLGGSTVFGWGSEEANSIPRYIEELTRAAIKDRPNLKVRVLNAGVPWYASWHEAAQLMFRLLPLKPDWVIVMDGLNDVAYGIQPTWAPVAAGYVDRPTQLAYLRNKIKDEDRTFLLDLVWTSPSFRYFYSRWKTKQLVETGVFNPELWDQYLGYMGHLHQLTKSNGIHFSAFLQPVIVLDRIQTKAEQVNNSSSLKNPQIAESFRKLYLHGESRLENEAKFSWHSLKSTFKTADYHAYFDGLHYTGSGNYHIAKAIFEKEIAPNLSRITQSTSPRQTPLLH